MVGVLKLIFDQYQGVAHRVLAHDVGRIRPDGPDGPDGNLLARQLELKAQDVAERCQRERLGQPGCEMMRLVRPHIAKLHALKYTQFGH